MRTRTAPFWRRRAALDPDGNGIACEGTAGITGGVLSDTGGFPVAALGEAALLLAGAALVRRLLR